MTEVRTAPAVVSQAWEDLAFLHWPVDATAVRPLVPAGLLLDTFEGRAWVSVVPFRMSGTRRRGCPPIPGLTAMPELNVRTYVTHEGRPGVWFLSLDVPSRLAVWFARRAYHLPYFLAGIRLSGTDSGGIEFLHRRRRGPAATFEARYRPTGPAAVAAPGSAAHFLAERYCLFAADPAGGLWRADVAHAPWPLQPAEVEIESNTMGTPFGLPLAGPPALVHFARRVEVGIHAPERVSTDTGSAPRAGPGSAT